MATAETCDLGPPHPPKEESIKAFSEVLPELKKKLVHLRHEYNKHEPEYFAAVEGINDHELAGFGVENIEAIRVGQSAYGIHLFAKIRIPALPDDGPAYIHVRVFTTGSDDPSELHSIHTEEKEYPDGDKKYRAIFRKDDELEWFNT